MGPELAGGDQSIVSLIKRDNGSSLKGRTRDRERGPGGPPSLLVTIFFG